MGLLRTILIILLVYYGIKILSRIFAPYIVKYASKKMEKRFKDAYNANTRSSQPEGEITIDKMPRQKTSDKTTGEYIDFEEID